MRLVGEAAKLYKGNFQSNAGPEMAHPNLKTVAEDYNLSCFYFNIGRMDQHKAERMC